MTPAPRAAPDIDAFARQLLEAAPDAVLVVRPSGRIALVNRMTERLFGYSREELVGQPVELLVPDEYREAHVRHRQDFDRRPRVRAMGAERTLLGLRRNGTTFPVEVSLSPCAIGADSYVIAIVRDVTHHVELEARLRHASTHDALTDTFNRTFLDAERARWESELAPVGVVMVDVDGLKEVNDRHGHAAGDQLLRRVAVVLRAVAASDDVVVRLGGDEFVLLVPRCSPERLTKTLAALRQEVLRHAEVASGPPLRLSAGAALGGQHGGLAVALRLADERMYQEKSARRGRKSPRSPGGA